jgi:hypothetical protein
MAKKTTLKNVGKGIVSTSKKVLPVVGKGLMKVGTTAKGVAVKSAPIIENGVSVVYGTMAKGFDLGVQGVRTVAKGISKRRRSKKGTRKGGRRTRRR